MPKKDYYQTLADLAKVTRQEAKNVVHGLHSMGFLGNFPEEDQTSTSKNGLTEHEALIIDIFSQLDAGMRYQNSSHQELKTAILDSKGSERKIHLNCLLNFMWERNLQGTQPFHLIDSFMRAMNTVPEK